MSAQPAGPAGNLVTGSLFDFHRDPVGFLESNWRTYGDVARYRFFHMPVFQVAHPDDVREVLVDPQGAFVKGVGVEGFRPLVGKGLLLNEGDSHRRQRRMMQPAFHRQRIAAYAEAMVAETARLRDRWQDGATVDMSAEMNRLTLTIAARTLFGADLAEQDARDVAGAMVAFTQWYHQSTHPFGPLLQVLPTDASRGFKKAKKALTGVVDKLIRARREQGDTGDILSMLVFARDADGDGAAMDEEHVRDEAITLLVAGHETTGGTLAWAWSVLAAHPDIADRLAAEADAALGDRDPGPADVPALSYAEHVFAETLRLYPSATSLPRQATKEVKLRDTVVPAGAIVMPATWCTQRDPRWWPEPERFDPDRWNAEIRATRPKYAYYPFGGGARICIGEAFAWMEGTLVLAILARAWRVKVADGHVVEREAKFTLRPKGGLPMVLERR